MTSKLKKLLREERGITALETAIILIAFVVVASVFAFTILSAGTFSTERGREAIYAGLEQVSSSMEVYGSVIGQCPSAGETDVYTVTFTLASVAGGAGVNITDTASTSTGNVVVISYLDQDEHEDALDWTVVWVGDHDSDWLLEEGELAEVTIPLTGTGGTSDNEVNLEASTEFRLEVKPPQGGVLPILRTTPASFDLVMPLD
jgi:flagellin FlaB